MESTEDRLLLASQVIILLLLVAGQDCFLMVVISFSDVTIFALADDRLEG